MFAGDSARFSEADAAWVAGFGAEAAQGNRSLLGRYRLLGLLLKRLGELRETIEKDLTARSPLETYEDIDPKMRDKLEDELAAAIEAEYRRQRTDLVGALHWWLRDIWLQTTSSADHALSFPNLAETTRAVAKRVAIPDAMQNLEHIDRLQRQLHSNVQEALALEVGLLKLKL